MDCRNIQEKLSEYIDDTLSPQEKVTMDEHLKSCGECATALAGLKKMVEHVKNLETLNPPVWMTQKIMARVRAEAQPRKGLFQKLFYPLYIKLPVGAIATIAIALTTFYVFRTIEPEIKLAKAPTEESVPQVPKKEKEQQPVRRGSETDKIAPAAPPLPVPAVPMDKTKSEDRAVPKAPEPTRQVEMPQEQTSPAQLKTKDAAISSAAAPAKKEIKQETAPPAPMLSGRAEEKAERYRVIVRVGNVLVARSEIENNIAELNGRIVKRELSGNKDVLVVELDTSKLIEFIKRLRAVGEVSEDGSQSPQKAIEISIEITQK